MIREAGAEGAEVTVWGYTDDPTPKVTQAYADQLNQLGFDAEPKIIDGAVYFQTVGNREDGSADGLRKLVHGLPSPTRLLHPR